MTLHQLRVIEMKRRVLNTRTVAVGSFVRSTINAQGLTKGREYEVISVLRTPTFVGTFTTIGVRLENGGEALVGNPHLVLEGV